MERPSCPELVRGIVVRNIRALLEARARFERRKTSQQRVADAITSFTGSMTFVALHALLFGGWIVVNSGVVPGVRPFDPFPFVMLAMFASVEAIFLSTFVLISQNRMAQLAEQRAELDLQINLLAEQEITTVLALVDEIARKVGVQREVVDAHAVEALKQEVAPEAVLAQIEEIANEDVAARKRA